APTRKFYRTPKGSLTTEPSIYFPARAEAVFGCLLLGSAILVFGTNINQIFAIDLFASVLVLQSLPFLSAAGIAVLEGTRANTFGFWRRFRRRGVALSRQTSSGAGVWPLRLRWFSRGPHLSDFQSQVAAFDNVGITAEHPKLCLLTITPEVNIEPVGTDPEILNGQIRKPFRK